MPAGVLWGSYSVRAEWDQVMKLILWLIGKNKLQACRFAHHVMRFSVTVDSIKDHEARQLWSDAIEWGDRPWLSTSSGAKKINMTCFVMSWWRVSWCCRPKSQEAADISKQQTLKNFYRLALDANTRLLKALVNIQAWATNNRPDQEASMVRARNKLPSALDIVSQSKQEFTWAAPVEGISNPIVWRTYVSYTLSNCSCACYSTGISTD